jgi:hypothetical protein
MDFEAYVGRLTAEQTKELLGVILGTIDNTALIETLSEHLTVDDIDELQARLP